MINSIKASAILAVAGCLVGAIPVLAQNQSCQPIRLLLQADLDLTRPIPYIGWSGKVRGFLNDREPLNGDLYYGGPASTVVTGQTGHEEDIRIVLDFGPVTGKFVTVADRGVFQLRPSVSPQFAKNGPAPNAFGHYAATLKVAPSTDANLASSGWFINATGNISLAGMFLVNGPPPPYLPQQSTVMGIWNAEINGRLCNIAPH